MCHYRLVFLIVKVLLYVDLGIYCTIGSSTPSLPQIVEIQ